MAKKYTEEELYQKAVKELQNEKETELKNVGDKYSAEADSLLKQADADKKAASGKYAEDYMRSSVERLVNEKKLEERLANLGLSNSGYATDSKAALSETEKRLDESTNKKVESDQSEIDKELTKDLEKNYSEMGKESEEVAKEYDDKAREQAKAELKAIEEAEALEKAKAEAERKAKEKAAAEKKAKEEAERKAKEKAEKEKAKAEEKARKEREKAAAKEKSAKEKAFMKQRNDDLKELQVIFKLKNSQYGDELTGHQKYDLFDKLYKIETKYKGTIGELTRAEIVELCGRIKTDINKYYRYVEKGMDASRTRNVKVGIGEQIVPNITGYFDKNRRFTKGVK